MCEVIFKVCKKHVLRDTVHKFDPLADKLVRSDYELEAIPLTETGRDIGPKKHGPGHAFVATCLVRVDTVGHFCIRVAGV